MEFITSGTSGTYLSLGHDIDIDDDESGDDCIDEHQVAVVEPADYY